VFLATHFFRAHTSKARSASDEPVFDDPVTAGLAVALGPGRVHVLPRPDRRGGEGVGRPAAEALAMVASFKLDVVVYPELGMDAITVSHGFVVWCPKARTRRSHEQCPFDNTAALE
jgi:hypothetical protein